MQFQMTFRYTEGYETRPHSVSLFIGFPANSFFAHKECQQEKSDEYSTSTVGEEVYIGDIPQER